MDEIYGAGRCYLPTMYEIYGSEKTEGRGNIKRKILVRKRCTCGKYSYLSSIYSLFLVDYAKF